MNEAKQRYFEMCREERNLTAILYSMLLRQQSLAKFLSLVDVTSTGPLEQAEVYYEFSYLRDHWAGLKSGNYANRAKGEFIIGKLGLADKTDLYQLIDDPKQFNEFFGLGLNGGQVSHASIESPSNWTIRGLNTAISDDGLFKKACALKWSFNIKPDILVHLPHNEVICIEAKYDSASNRYPDGKVERDICAKRGLASFGQVEMQHYMLTQVLGYGCHNVLINKSGRCKTQYKSISWSKVFEQLDIGCTLTFVEQWISRFTKSNGRRGD